MEQLKVLNTTLVLIRKDNKVLLAEKKRGFAKGTYNGIGGKQDPGETIDQAMVRETQEEINVTPTKYEQVGLINFDTWYKGEHVDLNLNIYTCDEYDGTITETEEMIPEWFDIDKVPFDRMLPDDVKWFPIVINGGCVAGKVILEADLKTCTQNIYEVSKEQLLKNINDKYGKGLEK